MEEMNLTAIPATVEQAVETLIEFYSESRPEILTMSLQEFEGSAHYGTGLFIRNSWCLWWYEGHSCNSWPREKPALVKYLNDIGVLNPDHMSSILMVCFHKKVHSQLLG